MIARCGDATAVSDLLAPRGLARAAGPQLRLEERRDPRSPPRSCRLTTSLEQTASVLGRPSGVRGTDPAVVPGWPTAADRHSRYDPAVAPEPGETTLDPAP